MLPIMGSVLGPGISEKGRTVPEVEMALRTTTENEAIFHEYVRRELHNAQYTQSQSRR